MAQNTGNPNSPGPATSGVQGASPDTSFLDNLSPEQKYQRDLFIFQKLKAVDDLVKQEHRVQARQILEELVKLDPNPYSTDVHTLLAETCYKLGNNTEAINNYQYAIKYARDNKREASVSWNIALCYMNISDYDHAAEWCNRVIAKNPSNDLRRQAERCLADLSQEKTSEQAVNQRLNGGDSGDYLQYLEVTNEANRWPQNKLPIRVCIEDGSRVPGYRPEYASIFISCLEIWTRASKNRLTFQIVSGSGQGDLDVIFTANPDDIAQKPGLAPAEQGLATVRAYHIHNKPGIGNIESAKIQLLVHKPTSQKLLTDDEMKGVCLHELGHALGLNGHSPNEEDIMHFLMSFRQLPALTKRDKQTMALLYQDYPDPSQFANMRNQPGQWQQAGSQFPQQQFQQPQQFQQQQFQSRPQFQQQAFQQPQQQQQQFQQRPQYQPQYQQQQPQQPQFQQQPQQPQFPQQAQFQPTQSGNQQQDFLNNKLNELEQGH